MMNPNEQKDVIFKTIKADTKNKCLTVHYACGGGGNQNNFKQIIKIHKQPANKSLVVEKVARKILKQSRVIPRSHFYDLIAELTVLEQRKCPGRQPDLPLAMYNFLDFNSEMIICGDFEAVPKLENLEAYMEWLYDDIDDKIKGAYLILKLLRQTDCLEELAQNDRLLCALSRVFREDGKKSLDLAICIACIFGHFSKYSNFSFAITNYKVGSTCLELIYHEMLREESWWKELNKTSRMENGDRPMVAVADDENSGYEKLSVSHQNLVKKQNIFFRYALYILLNISDDLKLEYKIYHKGIVSILGKLLERNSQDLLLIVVLFLKKLSVFVENKCQMKEFCIYKGLSPLLYLENDLLIANALKLIYNLMIDRDIRIYYIRAGLFPKLVSFFLRGRFVSVLVSIFYLISCEPKYVTVFRNNEPLITALMEKLSPRQENNVDADYKTILQGLMINLAVQRDVARIIIHHPDLPEIISAAVDDQNVHMLRLCRNLSGHQEDCFRLPFMAHLVSITELIGGKDTEEQTNIMAIDLLTNLANGGGIEWLPFLKQNESQFSRFLFNLVKNPSQDKSTNNLMSHVLLFIGAMVAQSPPEVGEFLLQEENQIVESLLNWINLNQESDEIVLYSVYCFYVLIRSIPGMRTKIFRDTKLTDYLVELMYDKNYKIKTLCTNTLDLISEEDEELRDRIKVEKFRSHNAEWLNMVMAPNRPDSTEHASGSQPVILEDMFLYPDLFLKMDLLNDSSTDDFSDNGGDDHQNKNRN